MCEDNVSMCFIQKRIFLKLSADGVRQTTPSDYRGEWRVNETMDEYVVKAPDEGNVSHEVEPEPEENAEERECNNTQGRAIICICSKFL